MSPPTFFSLPGRPAIAQTVAEIHELAAWISDPDRTRPVVVITPRNRHRDPYFPTDWVQQLVSVRGDVVAIRQTEGSKLTRELQWQLPKRMDVYDGAARIYWPFHEVGDRPAAHPRVTADRGDTATEYLRGILNACWQDGPGATPAPTPTTAKTHPTPQLPEVATSPAVGEGELQLEIMHAWLALLPDAVDRNRFALQPYRLHHELVEQLEALQFARAPIAAAAARILSGYAWTQRAPIPRRVERDGSPVLRRHDRAVAWRYPLPGREHFLYYWQPPVGAIALVRFAGLEHVALPNAEIATEQPTPPPQQVAPQRSGAAPPPPPGADLPPTRAPEQPPPSSGPQTEATSDATAFSITDDDLVAALKRAREPLLVGALRQALSVPEDVSRQRVARVLVSAVERGVIARTGQRGGTRYSVPD